MKKNRQQTTLINFKENMMFKKNSVLIAVVIALGSQHVDANEGGEDENAVKENRGIEIIQVTSQKRIESIQDVGAAVSAVSGEHLLSASISEPRDLFQLMPNVSIQSNGSAGQLQLGVRGISFATFSPIGVQPVMVFQDDVVLNSPQVAGLFIFDLERVELLRGPQNILYGRNTTGGAVNFITRKPEVGDDTNGYAQATIGSYGQRDIEFAVGSSISDDTAYRLSFQSINHDGYWDNKQLEDDRIGDRNQNLVRLQVIHEIGKDSSILFNVHGGVSEGGQRAMKFHGFVDPTNSGDCSDFDFDDLQTSCLSLTGQPTNSKTDEAYSDLRNDVDDINSFGSSITYNRSFSNFDLTSITAYEENSYNHWEDADATSEPFLFFRQKSDTKQWSQEFRLVSNLNSDVSWITGLFLFSEKANLRTTVPLDLRIFEVGFFGDAGKLYQKNTMLSPFGQIEYKLNEKLTILGGLRYIWEKKSGNGAVFSTFGLEANDINDPSQWLFESLQPFAVSPTSEVDFDESFNQWGGQLSLEYKSDNGSLFYSMISRGEKSGQFTDAPEAISAGTFNDYALPEEVIAYEVGYKASLLEDSLMINIAAFFNDYKNQHVQISVPTEQGVYATVVNAAESYTAGIEIETKALLGNDWFLDLSIGMLKSEVEKDSLFLRTGGALSIEEGRELPNAPSSTVNLGLTKEIDFSNGSNLELQINVRYTSERNFNIVDTQESRHLFTDPSYMLLNAFAEYKFGDDQEYKLAIWGKNLTDELYFQHMQDFGFGQGILFASNPRQVGITLGIEF